MWNPSDFLAFRQLDLDNKLILPTQKLLSQVSFQLNSLYQDIRNALIDAHRFVAGAAKQVYEQPIPTLTAWYEQSANSSKVLYAQVQGTVSPIYQDWQVKLSAGKEQAGQYLQAFWDNPEQVTVATFEPVSRYVADVADQSARYWQAFMENPELFVSTTFAPITAYLSSLSDEAEAVLTGSYYALADFFSLLMAQPSATFQALYRNTLSSLLDVYFDVVSSLLVLA
ncbi:MAG: hypothetical protein PHH59_00930 [Methylovulum sp.]|uniref:hypothetical protein n=1 Tax=Methylovulum sp. TaxID=1916980 RepID=UPI0026191156|nr:hypothetical protein [Methylovulum sp.]MDD2722571.1 hypothetical protein [Methylovulum sp.]MDD5123099.1 hypothetical protein [Methylovulum sp.]